MPSTMGLAGHGMLIAPACPCRVVRIEDLLVIGRGYRGPLITECVIKAGKSPATEPPTEARDGTLTFGPDGPTLKLDGVKLEEILLSLDAGPAPEDWDVLAPGFWFSLPRAMALYSPDPDEPGSLPELHHTRNTDALVVFARIARDAHEIVVTGPDGASLARSQLAVEGGSVNVFELRYANAGEMWIQRKYALPYDAGKAIVVTAQGPESLWDDVQAAAEHVARSFAPME